MSNMSAQQQNLVIECKNIRDVLELIDHFINDSKDGKYPDEKIQEILCQVNDGGLKDLLEYMLETMVYK